MIEKIGTEEKSGRKKYLNKKYFNECKKKLEFLGTQYNNSLLNCLHASFLVASEILVPEKNNILICTFNYSGGKSHVVAIQDNLYFDLWVGAILDIKFNIIYKFSFFNQDKYNRFYVNNKPTNPRIINIEYFHNK